MTATHLLALVLLAPAPEPTASAAPAAPADASPQPGARPQPDLTEAPTSSPPQPAAPAQPAPATAPGVMSGAPPAPPASEDISTSPRDERKTARARGPERPIRYRVDLEIPTGGTVILDPAYDAFSYRRHALQIGAHLRVDVPLGSGRVFLGGGLGYRYFGSGGNIHAVLQTDLDVHEPHALGRLSVVLVEGADLTVQLAAGPSLVELETWSTLHTRQLRVAGMGEATLGAALYLPKKWLPRRGSARVTAGLDLAVGYAFRSPVDLQPSIDYGDLDPDERDELIPTATSSLGSVLLHGVVWRFGLFVRFM